MQIGYILNTYPQPSQSFIRREIQALEALGHEVTRLAMRRADIPLVDTQDRTEETRTHYVLEGGAAPLLGALMRRLRATPRRFFNAFGAAWQMGKASEVGRLRHLIYLAEAAKVAEMAQAEGLDHLHAHFGTNAACVAMLARHLGGPGYSFTVHGPEEFDAPRQLSLGRKVSAASFVVAISQYGRSQLCRWADPTDWDKIEVVHCGIESDKFPAPSPLRDGPRHLVCIGRLVEQKGHLALIEALARADEAVTLSLIGDGPLRGQIEERIATSGLADRVRLLGWCDEAQILQELSEAQALVLSSFAEGLPMVLMEAMAAGRPVIATYIAGIPELVQEGRNGWLVPAGDVEALARAIDTFARAPLADLGKMGEAARHRALERHDVAKEAARLAQIIKRRSSAV